MSHRILVPIDFSEASKRALDLAVQHAARTAGELTLLHVGTLPHTAADFPMLPSTSALMLDLNAKVTAEHLRGLGQVASEHVPEAMAPRLVQREGPPWREILEEITTGEYTHLYMGTHGRHGIQRALLGSVTERVLRESPIPVTVTR